MKNSNDTTPTKKDKRITREDVDLNLGEIACKAMRRTETKAGLCCVLVDGHVGSHRDYMRREFDSDDRAIIEADPCPYIMSSARPIATTGFITPNQTPLWKEGEKEMKYLFITES